MSTHRCPELTEVISSVGARIALQKVFSNDICEETNVPFELPVASTSTSAVTPTLTLASQDMFDVIENNEMSINSDIETSLEDDVQSSEETIVKTSDTQNMIILNTSCDNEPARKKQKIETVNNKTVS